ncbi:DUF2798 domain-containing protein [Alkalihalobacillus sp. 1P02AB]|uniref:DUF2798 domain-containing protein n=1 Tax=Alkalihalobacillus sp. 1P02AB TaxID=3132260 RepID=UPI0039A48B55
MAFSMSLFITFILVSLNFGFSNTFLLTWLKLWPQAFICAFFGAFFFPKLIHQLIKKINFIEVAQLKSESTIEKK